MYERFTDRSRKVMSLANQHAQRFNHEYIAPEHMLLGLVQEGSGVGATTLKNLDVDLRKLKAEIEKLVTPGPDMVIMGKLPLTPNSKVAIEAAINEARILKHNYVGTEHLLLGLLSNKETVASKSLAAMGITADSVREEVLNLLGAEAEKPEAKAWSVFMSIADQVTKPLSSYTDAQLLAELLNRSVNK